ncbi:MAG: hypothetical protein AAF602_10605 [Myxococcota bacterium]
MWLTLASTALASCSPALAGPTPALPPPDAPFTEEARIDGLVARWRVDGDDWVVQLEAATTGWLVLGTNPVPGLTGASLYFGRVVDGIGDAAHHTVLAPGRHEAANPERVTLLAAAQQDGATAVRLRFPAPVVDADGGTWLILAWSRSPDLDHHSAVRQHVYVR